MAMSSNLDASASAPAPAPAALASGAFVPLRASIPTSTPGPASADPSSPSEHLKTELLRRIAHDIASPAGVAMTVLDELTTAGELRPELVAMARRSVRRLLRLSEQLALVSELETGGMVPAIADVDLRAITAQAMVDALAIDGRRDVTTTFRDDTRALVVGADSRILLLLVREVIGNALKLAGSRVEVSISSADDVIELRVEDDGPGFSASSTAMLGQRFVTHASARGLGLSLSMAMQILRFHGGGVRVEPSSLPHGRQGLPGAAVVLSFRESKAR